jgi:hypothetical protein
MFNQKRNIMPKKKSCRSTSLFLLDIPIASFLETVISKLHMHFLFFLIDVMFLYHCLNPHPPLLHLRAVFMDSTEMNKWDLRRP